MYRPVLALFVLGGVAAWGQAQNSAVAPARGDKAAAYYHYTLAHMYAELAGSSSAGRNEYINKAIENYKLAIKDDTHIGVEPRGASEHQRCARERRIPSGHNRL